MAISTLREQHAYATSTRIFEAVAALLERGSASELTVPAVARAAGVSLRTVYRYFPTHDELLEAAGAWIADMMRTEIPATLDEIAPGLAAAFLKFDERPGLVRALALSQAGRSVRKYRRRRRLKSMWTALATELPWLADDEIRRAEAVLAYLVNMLAYTTMRDETGLSGSELGRALMWAIDTLIADLRRRNDAAGATGRRKARKEEP
jgi:AcrR family transcriptional regulator